MISGKRVQKKSVQRRETVSAGRAAAPLSATRRRCHHLCLRHPGGLRMRGSLMMMSRFICTRVSSSAEPPSKAQSRSDMFGSNFNVPCPAFKVSPVKSAGSSSPHPTRSSALWFLCWNTSKLLAQCRLRGGQRYNLQIPTCAESSSDWTGPSGPATPTAVAPLLPQFGRAVA